MYLVTISHIKTSNHAKFELVGEFRHVYRSVGAAWVQIPSHCFALHDDGDDVSILSGLLPEKEGEQETRETEL